MIWARIGRRWTSSAPPSPTPALRALRRRAADFGFVLRYPKGKEAVTGIGYEPWHFRYVGWPHAKLMEERHLVLEEYLEWLHDFPLGGEPLRFRGLGRLFELYYLPVWAADTLTLPADAPASAVTPTRAAWCSLCGGMRDENRVARRL